MVWSLQYWPPVLFIIVAMQQSKAVCWAEIRPYIGFQCKQKLAKDVIANKTLNMLFARNLKNKKLTQVFQCFSLKLKLAKVPYTDPILDEPRHYIYLIDVIQTFKCPCKSV